ncbi:hypothetical protein HPL003_12885 [Paenibacillus terrae HPL-003]|uniref:Uncharacterized protein n=1 Tax=Paenibacillus terrae (strain HPL-003) TaxID=985665 RepID=G7VWC9_PAETH|nr:hypothetical protein HPL003_12885 [Paenibacillus terrae HPL-003]
MLIFKKSWLLYFKMKKEGLYTAWIKGNLPEIGDLIGWHLQQMPVCRKSVASFG